MPSPDDPYLAAHALADRLESSMRDNEIWPGAPPPGPIQIKGAFGRENMAFEQWLAWVFLPRLRQIVAQRGDFPPGSQVAAYAVREFDGRPECQPATDVLIQIDELVNGLAGQ